MNGTSSAPRRGASSGWDALALAVLAARFVTCLAAGPGPAVLPEGSDWPQYLGAARMAAGDTEPALLAVWPDWRPAVYPRLLGAALAWTERGLAADGRPGEHVAAAAHLVGVVGIAGVLLGGWALARALGGVRAGLATAVLLAAGTLLVPAAAWLNPYALLAGLVAGSLAGAATWLGDDAPRSAGVAAWAGAFATGGLAGLAWGVDPRGIVAVAAVVLAAVAGRVRLRPVPRGASYVAAVLVGIVLGRSLERACAPDGQVGAKVAFTEQVRRQIGLAREEWVARGPAEVVHACGGDLADSPRSSLDVPGDSRAGVPSIPMFTRALVCARSLLPYNLAERHRDGELPAWPFLLLAGLPFLAPARDTEHRRGVHRGVVLSVLGLPLAALLVNASIGLLPDRYLLVFLAPLLAGMGVGTTMLVAGVCARVRAGRWRELAGLVLVGGIVAAAACVGPAPRVRVGPSKNGAAARDWLRAHLTAGDAAMDCAGLGLGALWLPARLHPAPYNLTGSDAHGCDAWVHDGAFGAGTHYVLTGSGGPRASAGPGWQVIDVFAAQTLPEEPPVTLWRAVAAPQ